MATCSGIVSNSLGGTTLTFTDTGTGYSTIISRILTIYDYQGNILTVINMGTSLTANYTISADGYYQFALAVTDTNGSYSCTVNILAYNIYAGTFLTVIKVVGCSCNVSSETFNELIIGELFLAASLRFALGGFAVAAQNNITAANMILNP